MPDYLKKIALTGDGGVAISLIAGSTLYRGDIVYCSGNDSIVSLVPTSSAATTPIFGVVYADADETAIVWVVISGIALVNFESAVYGIAGHYWIPSSYTDGVAKDSTNNTTNLCSRGGIILQSADTGGQSIYCLVNPQYPVLK